MNISKICIYRKLNLCLTLRSLFFFFLVIESNIYKGISNMKQPEGREKYVIFFVRIKIEKCKRKFVDLCTIFFFSRSLNTHIYIYVEIIFYLNIHIQTYFPIFEHKNVSQILFFLYVSPLYAIPFTYVLLLFLPKTLLCTCI